MKLIIIRHGDPDYEHDTLTEKGWREAKIISDRVTKLDVKDFYVSPMGRAKDTASISLKKLGREAEVYDWLHEFDIHIKDDSGNEYMLWDRLPVEWTSIPEYYDKDNWCMTKYMKDGHVYEAACAVYNGLDELLMKHGYKRNGSYYEAVKPNCDTVVLFCHFGVECLMLGYILGISPMVLWHGFCAAPTSVTTLITEERRKGIAYFRMCGFGDISHLYAVDEPVAFAARFCEMYDNFDERHD